MTKTLLRWSAGVMVVLTTFVLTAPHALAALAQQPPAGGQSEFVPIDQLPPAEQLPAAPLLIAAYAVAWVAVLAYVWSIWRRLAVVERELKDVARKIGESQRRA